MIRLAILLLAWLLACSGIADAGAVTLTRGVNVTNWFRYPPSRDPVVLAKYLNDQALADLRTAGFDFVRLAIDPDVVSGDAPGAVLIAAIRRIQTHGMAVIVSPHPHTWQVETGGDRLVAFWRELAPKLAALDQARTLPEVLNEPVFPNDPVGWAALQHRVLGEIRHVLPLVTVVLTGNDWGSIGGLLALTPEADRNVLYSFHFYDPAELTSLAAYRHDADHAALRRLPFPADQGSDCDAAADESADAPTRDLMHYYCSLSWDAPRIAAMLDRVAAWSRWHGVRLLAGEFGASAELNAAARLGWLKTVREASESRNIGWALWGYDDIMGFALRPPPGVRPELDHAVLSALGMTVAK
jgi:endoglucanase